MRLTVVALAVAIVVAIARKGQLRTNYVPRNLQELDRWQPVVPTLH